MFAYIVERVKKTGSNCNLGKPHLNPNQMKTKESLAQNIKDETHKQKVLCMARSAAGKEIIIRS